MSEEAEKIAQGITKKNILIVGDGNFSFSLSFAREHLKLFHKNEQEKLGLGLFEFDGSNVNSSCGNVLPDHISVYATSYDGEEKIKNDQLAWNNVQTLRSINGVTVLHDVDATKLETRFDPNKLKFHEIIFNFPHVGGKSNIKACRKLLEQFFLCAGRFLQDKGRVSISLCKGQGGTPIDAGRNGYGNSWQVSTQAAVAGFVLINVKPFEAIKVPSYEPAGYRGRLHSGFIRKGSLTHIFIKKKHIEGNQFNFLRNVTDTDLLIEFADEYYLNKLKKFNPYTLPWHPFAATIDILSKNFQKLFESKDLTRGCTSTESKCLPENDYLSNDGSDVVFGFKNDGWKCLQFQNRLDEAIVHISEIFIDSTVDISPYLYPIYREMVFSIPSQNYLSIQDLIQKFILFLQECFGTCCEMQICSKQCKPTNFIATKESEAVSGYDPSKVPTFLNDIQTQSWLSFDPEVVVSQEDKADFNIDTKESSEFAKSLKYEKVIFSDYEFDEHELEYFDAKKKHVSHKMYFDPESEMWCITVNGVVVANCSAVSSSQDDNKERTALCNTSSHYATIIRVDHLCMALLGIDDVRLLWAREEESFLTSLRDFLLNNDDGHEFPLPPIFYPLCYRHDLCFWLNELQSECLLLASIRYCCQDTVHSVQLLRILRHEESKVVSYCYRMIYSRCDGPLSHKETVELQNRLRLCLMELKFDLR